jgi:DUF4097 and DUF4098 domain-containing protein YvlB
LVTKSGHARLRGIEATQEFKEEKMSRKIGLGLCCLVFFLAAASRAFSQSHIEKDMKLAPGGRLMIDASASDVFVTGGPESGAHVVVTSNRADLEDLFAFHFDEEPGAVRIEVHKLSAVPRPKSLQLRMEVRVPTKTNVEIRTGGGDVKVSHIEGDTNLETSGGDVGVRDLAGNLTARTSGGDIELRDLTGDVNVKTSGGDITLQNAHGRIDARTSGGDVKAELARGNAKGGEIETSGGDIELRLDPAVSLDLDASTSSGEVTSSLPLKTTGVISPSRLHATLGSGGETLRLHTNGGSVHIGAL